MPKAVIVTGVAELDAKLAQFAPKLQKKFVRSALRKGGKRVLTDFKEIVRAEARDTGAYERAAAVRATKRSRSSVGVQIVIDAAKLRLERFKRTGKTTLKKKSEIRAAHGAEIDEMYYYPASLEFGYTRQDGTKVPAIRAQRRALYDNEQRVKQDFIADVQGEIAAAGK